MSDLRPKGIKVELCGETFELLFTIDKVDEIQSLTGLPLFDAIAPVVRAADGATDHETLDGYKTVAAVLLSTDRRTLSGEDVGNMVTFPEYRRLAWKMLQAFGLSTPEPDEDEEDGDEDPNGETGR